MDTTDNENPTSSSSSPTSPFSFSSLRLNGHWGRRGQELIRSLSVMNGRLRSEMKSLTEREATPPSILPFHSFRSFVLILLPSSPSSLSHMSGIGLSSANWRDERTTEGWGKGGRVEEQSGVDIRTIEMQMRTISEEDTEDVSENGLMIWGKMLEMAQEYIMWSPSVDTLHESLAGEGKEWKREKKKLREDSLVLPLR